MIHWAISTWVRRGVSCHHCSAWVEGLKQPPERGDLWLDLSATRLWDSTAPVAWSRADSEMRRRRIAGGRGRRAWSYRPRRSPCVPRWCRYVCTTMTPSGRRGLRGPYPGAPCGSLTPTQEPAPLVGPEPPAQQRPGRWRAPISPSDSGSWQALDRYRAAHAKLTGAVDTLFR